MRRGLTLIELLVAGMLISVLVGAFAWTLIAGFKFWASGNDRAIVVQNADHTIKAMFRDISEATTITEASSENITFSADINDNDTPVTVSYALTNNTLERTIGSNTVTLAPNVQSITISYKNSSGATIIPVTQQDRDTIRMITIRLTMSKASENFSIGSSVRCRNLN